MLVHLRLNVPDALVQAVLDLLVGHAHVTNVVRHPGASLDPRGDLIEVDVARESASSILEALDELGLPEVGGVVLIAPSSTPFKAARRLEKAAPGDPSDAVIWDSVLSDAWSAVRPTISFQVFLVLATILAGVAVITDSAVLVVGAMVVGPEFGAVAAICTGLVFGKWLLTWRGLRLLVGSFAFAILLVATLGLVGSLVGLIEPDMVTRPRPQTGFIWHPDRWSFVVALVAGAAGVLALSTDKASALVGVFISVTTVPAAGNLALALAAWETSEMSGAAAQLAVNLTGMVLAGTLVLWLQRRLWHRVAARTDEQLGLRR